jgi:hypothetical protein
VTIDLSDLRRAGVHIRGRGVTELLLLFRRSTRRWQPKAAKSANALEAAITAVILFDTMFVTSTNFKLSRSDPRSLESGPWSYAKSPKVPLAETRQLQQ